MKRVFLCVFALLVAEGAYAQDAGKTFVAEMTKHWESSKALSLAVADAMPTDSYSFKATDAEMSFGEQMNHIAAANGSYCAAALGVKSPITKPADASNKATAIKNLTASYDFCMDGLSKLDDKGLQETVTRNSNVVSKFELFWGGFTHTAHHRGQAEVYLRLKGVTPPSYKF
jgi:uncharacterized damage-inducible protein DinB